MRRDWNKVRAIMEALEGAGWGQRVHLARLLVTGGA